MSEPITIKERRAVEWREQEVSYTYEDLLELFGDDDGSTVRPLVLRCMALEQERATFYSDYRKKFDVETKALHAERERLERERDEARALAEQFQHELDTVNRLANIDQQQLIEARVLLRECRPWVARGLDDHPAPTDNDRGLLARIDACLVPKVKP